MVHGDDFAAIGDPKHLEATEDALRNKYNLKTDALGYNIDDKKELRIHNKVV